MHGNPDILPLGLLPLELRVLDGFRSFCRMKEFGDGFGCVIFCTLIDIVSETAIVFFRTLPVGFPLRTISKSSLFTLFCPLILDHGVCLIISISGLTILDSSALRDNLLLMSFLGHGPPCEGPPPYPRPPCAGVVVVVVWCVGAVCVQDFRGCVQDLGTPPDSPSAGSSPDSPSAGPPPPDRPKFRHSRSHFRSFSLSGGLLVEFWWCLKRQDPQMSTFGLSGCRVKPQRLLQNVKNNFTIDLPPPLVFRKSQ